MDRRQFLTSTILGSALAGRTLQASGESNYAFQAENPYKARQNIYRCDLLVVGGSSAGTVAALTAGRLGLDTVFVMCAPRDLGGLESNGLNPDSDMLIRCIGGFSMELDILGRIATGRQIEETKYVAPPHVIFNYFRREFEKLPNVTIVADYYPDSVKKDETRIDSLVFRNRKRLNETITVFPKMTIDAEIEGDVTYLAGVSTTLMREGKVPSDDPTRDQEYSAGEIYTPAHGSLAGGDPLPQSTFQADNVPRTMGWSAILVLEKYDVKSPDNPWLLTLPPSGYNPKDYEWMRGIGGVALGDRHFRCSMDRWSSFLEGWKMPDGRHVLTSMNIRDREANERRHFARTLGVLYYAQHELGKTEWGLSSKSFREGVPAKYTLADFGTSTRAGDAPLPSQIYMREGRRMVNDHVFGGKLMEDQGTEAIYQKDYWHPRSFYFNGMNIDIHGVTKRFVEGSGPEGAQVPRFINPNFGVCCIPFDVCIPRTAEATGLLVASAGAYTHQAYSAFPRMEPGRFQIGETCGIAAYIAKQNDLPLHHPDMEQIQLEGLIRSGHSIVYFDDAMPGTWNHTIDQMLGARGVPLYNSQGKWISEAGFTNTEALECLENLFVTYSMNPISHDSFQRIVDPLRSHGNDKVTWEVLLPVVAELSGFDTNSDFDTLINRCIGLGYFRKRVASDTPVGFSEFKRILFNFLFADKSSDGPYPLEGGNTIVRDTFNRPDEQITQPEIGDKYTISDTWVVRDGLAVPSEETVDSFLWTDKIPSSFAVSCDVFLEQTQTEACAGLALSLPDSGFTDRFVFHTQGFEVAARFERVYGTRIECLSYREFPAYNTRGFTIRLTKDAGRIRCAIGHKVLFEIEIDSRIEYSQIALFNGAGRLNLFDNFHLVDLT